MATLPGRTPRQADLRRAISSAYYALFHAVAIAVADDIVGSTRRASSRYALLYRSIDHRKLRELCEDVGKQTPPKKIARYVPTGGFGSDLMLAADAVIDLQEKRHLADYDPAFRAAKSDVVVAVTTGRTALAHLRAAPPAQLKAFLTLVAFPPR